MWLVNFVKEKEGFRANAYQDAVGVWTIGYGSTKGVKKGDRDELADVSWSVSVYILRGRNVPLRT